MIKTIFIVLLTIILIYIILNILCIKNVCNIFKKKYTYNKTSEQLRELTNHILCKKKVSFPISKYIYLNNNIFGAYTNKTLLLSPTTNLYEVILDIHIGKEKFYNFYVHSGALKAYMEIKPQLTMLEPTKVAGYSLGALVSILYAYDLWKTKGIKIKLFLIGVPAIGNKKFQKEFNSIFSSTTYINNNNDYISNNLFGLFNYYHIGKKNENKYNYINKGFCRFLQPHFRYF